jgi:putative membrane-bound dehydrogenase-like protein
VSRSLFLSLAIIALGLAVGAADDAKQVGPAAGAKGLDEALRNLHAPLAGGKPLPAAESRRRLQVPADLAVDLVAAEPVVRQPLYLTFDERGRMWVVQYLQYPFPSGLKIVAYDQYIRAKFDRVPPPPPQHFRGADRITIHEDTAGTGTFDKVTVFTEGLNITTAALPGRGGVWVLNPPYLLFYPDPRRSDVADPRPQVHLSGFGLEDTHAVANSLTWGPDGWLYGAHGSTCTARVKVEITGARQTTDFLGQAIWRYHPETHRFEIYAEGGGNTFGVAFDDQGRVYSGTNGGVPRGVHYVQGGYYIKGWGKHGPLTNPYALGWLEHMPHTGNHERFTHTFIVYGGGALPERYNGRLLAVNPLQRRVQAVRREPLGSTYRTVEEPFVLTSGDGWFRPVDVKAGPDGAVYVCDFYENRISHVDPRDNWDRSTGRIYRIRSKDYRPAAPFDLGRLSSRELVGLLGHKNRWYRDTARRVLGDRKDRSVVADLRRLLEEKDGQIPLEALWAIHVCGGFEEAVALRGLDHADPFVRMWAVRLLGDACTVTAAEAARLASLAATEPHAQVRSQLASSARRLPAAAALPILKALLARAEDRDDPHIPLLLWWALEAKADSDRDAVLALFADPVLWRAPIVEGAVVERLAQRYALAGGRDNLVAIARLLRQAPSKASAGRLLTGLEKGFAARSVPPLPDELQEALVTAGAADWTGANLTLGLRLGRPESLARALGIVAEDTANKAERVKLIQVLGEVRQPRCVPVLLRIIQPGTAADVRREALAALQRYDNAEIAARVLELYPDGLPEKDGLRAAAQALLVGRPGWALQLLRAVEVGKVNPRQLPLDVVRKLALHRDPEIAALVRKHWGQLSAATSAEKQREMVRLATVVRGGKGDALAGKAIYTNACAKCHKLFGEGGDVGPDLTGYERDNLAFWIENIVDPNAAIREEYQTFIVTTHDGRLLTGVVGAQDKRTVTLRDAEGKAVRVAREDIDEMRASPVSLMPEDQLKPLADQQVRDLFAYLMSKGSP